MLHGSHAPEMFEGAAEALERTGLGHDTAWNTAK